MTKYLKYRYAAPLMMTMRTAAAIASANALAMANMIVVDKGKLSPMVPLKVEPCE